MRPKISILALLLILAIGGCITSPRVDHIGQLTWKNLELSIAVTAAPTESADDTATWVLPEGKKIILRQIPMSQEEARVFLQERKDYIHALFQKHVDPYWGSPDPGSGGCFAGQIMDSPVVENDNSFWTQFDLKATADYVIGTCVDKDETYFLKMQVIYCKQTKSLFELKFYYPRSGGNRTQNVTLASCTNSVSN